MRAVRILFPALILGLLLTGCTDLIPQSGANADVTLPSYVRPEGETESVLANISVPTEPEADERQTMTHLAAVVTESNIHALEEYPALETLDLTGSTCYVAIMVYIRNHPEVEVTYTVDFGGATAVNWAENVVLQADGVDFSLLISNLRYLTFVKSLHLPRTGLTLAQIQALREQYPEVSITYTVDLLGQELTEDTAEVNIAGMVPELFADTARALELLPNLTYAELMDSSGYCSLTRSEVAQLVQQVPDIRFHYQFDLFGRTVSTTDGTITFKNLSLSAANETEIREALSILAPGSTLVLDNCGLDNEFLASIREDYTQVDLVWRIWFGTQRRYSTLTNDDTLRAVYNVTDDTVDGLRYCRSAKYIDMGHNDTLTDLTWLSGMPDLEILILSGCNASDLTGIENCTKLEFLELANCYKLADLTPLAGCYSLKYLNICFSKVSSLSPLDGLPIQNLFCKQTRVNADEQKEFKQIHPDATAVFTGKDPYAGPGWRYTDYGYTYTSFYKKVREVFGYDAVDQRIRASGES